MSDEDPCRFVSPNSVCPYKVHLQLFNARVGACGFVPDPSVSEWYCDLCQNEKVAEASLVSVIRQPVHLSGTEGCFSCRIPIVCFVPVRSGTGRAKNTTHSPTPSSAHVNQRKDKVGLTSCVLSSIPRLCSRILHGYASSKVSVLFLVIGGRR